MIKFLGAAIVLVAIALVLLLVFRRRLLVKYAALWIGVALVMLVLFAFPSLLDGVAAALGFQLTANFLFFSAIALLLAIALHLSVAITEADKRAQRLAEELALLTERVERIEEPLHSEFDDSP